MSRHVFIVCCLLTLSGPAFADPPAPAVEAPVDPALSRAIAEMPLPSLARRFEAQGAPASFPDTLARLARELRLEAAPGEAAIVASRR